MNQSTGNRRRLCMVCVTLLAVVMLCRVGAGAEVFGEYFVRPVVVSGSEKLRLIACTNSLQGERRLAFVSQDDDGEWREETQYKGTAHAAAASGGSIYVFGDETYAVYNDKGEWTQSFTWQRPWRVTSALGGERLWIFGGGLQFPEGDDAAGESKWRLHGSMLEADQWRDVPGSPGFDYYCGDIVAVRFQGRMYVFWRGRPADTPADGNDTVFYARVSLDGWEAPREIEGVAHTTKLAVSGGDRLHLWMLDSARGISDENPLVCRVFDGTQWSEPAQQPEPADEWRDRTLYLVGGRYKGQPAAITGSRQLIRIAPYEKDRPRPSSETFVILRLPVLMRVEVALGLGLIFSLLLLFVGFSMWRRGRHIVIMETPHGKVMLANWRLRVVANILDLSLIVLVSLLWVAFTSAEGPAGWEMLMMLHLLSMPYFAIAEIGMGQTPGKKMVGIAVVSRDGTPAGLLQIAIRSLFRLVDTVLLSPLGMLFILNTHSCQRLGDLLAGTVVVRIPRRPHGDSDAS